MVRTALDAREPLSVFPVPLDRLCESLLESDARLPRKLTLRLRRVHRVTPIVAQTVLDERHEAGVRPRVLEDRSHDL